MDVLKFQRFFKKYKFSGALLLLVASPWFLSGCLVTYLTKSAYNQADLLSKRKPIEGILKEPHTDPELRKKLELTLEVKKFAEESLGLKKTKNYLTYVDLKRPYVTYLLQASPVDDVKAYEWKFPIVGTMPYKGFFSLEDAKKAQSEFNPKLFDTHLRGVSAYSLLGWFDEPLLSSMARYADEDLVNTIIHETVHSTLFIKNSVEFNEALASFIANVGTERFYIAKEGSESPTVEKIKIENQDESIFSQFITSEIKNLRDWYSSKKNNKESSEETKHSDSREAQFAKIKENFKMFCKPKLKSKRYDYFLDLELNNALLISYDTYTTNFNDFEKAFALKGKSISEFLKFVKILEKHKNPAEGLKEEINSLQSVWSPTKESL